MGCKNPTKIYRMKKDQILSNKIHAVIMVIIAIILITINI